jgi:hypothetical protein
MVVIFSMIIFEHKAKQIGFALCFLNTILNQNIYEKKSIYVYSSIYKHYKHSTKPD